MLRAFASCDDAYDGVFVTAVRTTGIFCRPSCRARKPRPEHIEFFGTSRDAMLAGYRPCKRCRPIEAKGSAPAWLAGLLADMEAEPERRWSDGDLRERGLDPMRVRRWFKKHHAMTFHAYQRARRLGRALGQLRGGADLTQTAFAAGYESLSGFRDAFRNMVGETPGRSRARTLVLISQVSTPLGPMIVGASDKAVCLIEFADRPMLHTQFNRLRQRMKCVFAPGSNDVIGRLQQELKAYFDGERTDFSVELDAPGTEFQQEVWNRLREIPFADTRSYQQLARDIGRPEAVRAVARANGDNRIAILIPCHRVIGQDGQLRGYGGAAWRKRWLLQHEADVASAIPRSDISAV
jgi:AraC family transcriptional regulator of adaptative response/methylated-DNA-[protein]-cysteine methyltransferase